VIKTGLQARAVPHASSTAAKSRQEEDDGCIFGLDPLGKGKDDVVQSGNIVYLEQFRRRRTISSAIELTPMTGRDTKALSQRLCQDLAMTSARGPVPLESIASRTGMPKEDAMVAATYAHVCGWIIYSDGCIELTPDGRAGGDDASDLRSA
jgi:hypothetical protein